MTRANQSEAPVTVINWALSFSVQKETVWTAENIKNPENYVTPD